MAAAADLAGGPASLLSSAGNRQPEGMGRAGTNQKEAGTQADQANERGEDAALEAAPHAQQQAAGDHANAKGRLDGGQLRRAAAKMVAHQQRDQRAGRGE